MPTIFNETFASDKPIYYPSNWGSGKTALQEYQQYKNTFSYYMMMNVFEFAIAGIWIFVIFTYTIAVKEIAMIWQLDNKNLKKIQQRKYIQTNFLMGVLFLGFVIIVITGIVLMQPWGFTSFGKGIVMFAVLYFFKFVLNKLFKPKSMCFNSSDIQYQQIKTDKDTSLLQKDA